MQQSSSGGIGLTGVLTIVFVVLKLVGVVDWSWVWVLSPLWIGGAIGLTGLLILIVGLLAAASKQRSRVK